MKMKMLWCGNVSECSRGRKMDPSNYYFCVCDLKYNFKDNWHFRENTIKGINKLYIVSQKTDI